MTSEAERLRAELARAVLARRSGDLPERTFERRMPELSVALYRAVASERLAPGEEIRLEHHVIFSHLRLNQSVLREPLQETVSLFLTDRRLIRVRGRCRADQAVTGDDRDGTVVDERERAEISGGRMLRDRRLGEAAAGVVIAALAAAFHRWLFITGTLLIGLGVLGALHGLLLPTRTYEVLAPGREPLAVPAPGRASGRKLIAALAADRGRA